MAGAELPLVSSDLVARLGGSLVDAQGEHFGPGTVERIEGATVELPRFRPTTLVHVWGRPAPAELAGLLRRLEPEVRLDIVPGALSPQIAAVLQAAELHPLGMAPVLYGRARRVDTSTPPDVTVHEPQPGALAEWAGFWCDCWATPAAEREQRTAFFLASAPAPGRRVYVADGEGTPAAIAVLWIANGVGYLAGAATRPGFRDRGCQTALIRRRIAAAARAGCDLVSGGTWYDTPSQHNMERAGLRIAYFAQLWASA